MKELDKKAMAWKEQFGISLRNKEKKINALILEANFLIEKINAEIEALDEIISDVTSWQIDVMDDIDGFVDAQSPDWHQREEAKKYQDWKAQFEDMPTDAVDKIDELEEITEGTDLAKYLDEHISSSIDNV